MHPFEPTVEGVPLNYSEADPDGSDGNLLSEKPLVPFIKITQDRVTLEIQRGCIRGCRFCQAGQLYRPVRERDVDMLKQCAVDMLDSTGQDEISPEFLKLQRLFQIGGACNLPHGNRTGTYGEYFSAFSAH